MKIGICISMYDENITVLESLKNIKNYYEDAYCVVVQSRNNDSPSIEAIADKMFKLPNLELKLPKHKIPSYSLSRNYGKAFTTIYDVAINFDIIIALCGDTLVTDPSNFDRRYNDMQNNNKLA